MALVGNTVRITGTFFNFAGALTDPDVGTIFVQIYDNKKIPIGSPVNLTVGANKVSTGVFKFDYTIPVTSAPALIYEFRGTVDSVTSLNRGTIPVRWV